MSKAIEIMRVAAPELEPMPLLRRLHDDELQAVVVSGFYDADVVEAVPRKLEAMSDHPLWQHRDDENPEVEQHRVLGEPVSASDVHTEGPDRESYFAASEATRLLLAGLFPESRPFEQTVEALLADCSGGASVEAARDDRGRRYGAATIRVMEGGRGLPPHCENDYMHLPIYDDVRERVQLPEQLSFFMPLVLPTNGGQLVVHARRWQGPDAKNDGGPLDPEALLAEPHEILDLRPGDLVVFPAGRIFHSVRDWSTRELRWTIGGFGAFTRDGSRFLHWA